MLALRDPIFVWGNYAEAVLWSVLALVIAFKGRTRWRWVLMLALFAFGVSDVVEVRTGAWYTPWWMLAWKAACLLTILPTLVVEVIADRRARREGTPPV